MHSLLLSTTTEDTRTTSSNQANFLSCTRVARNCSWVANVLVVTTTVRVLYWIHRRATYFWPAIPLDPVFVEIVSCFEHRLIHAATASHNANNSTTSRRNRLSCARWHANSGFLHVIRMTDNHARRSRSASNAAAIRSFLFAHRDD